jgi:hypothetical protein
MAGAIVTLALIAFSLLQLSRRPAVSAEPLPPQADRTAALIAIPTEPADVGFVPPKPSVFPYSIIPGGASTPRALKEAIAADPVVSAHYANFDVARTRVVRLAEPRVAHVSYRTGNEVFWTRRPVLLPAGETLLTDGTHYARTRCGNQLAVAPGAVSAEEPAPQTLDTPVPAPQKSAALMPGVRPQSLLAGAVTPSAGAGGSAARYGGGAGGVMPKGGRAISSAPESGSTALNPGDAEPFPPSSLSPPTESIGYPPMAKDLTSSSMTPSTLPAVAKPPVDVPADEALLTLPIMGSPVTSEEPSTSLVPANPSDPGDPRDPGRTQVPEPGLALLLASGAGWCAKRWNQRLKTPRQRGSASDHRGSA